MQIIKPHKLKKGDKVGVISPSNSLKNRKKDFLKAKENFEKQLGLELVFSENAFAQHYYSAGTIEERISDFNSMLKDDEIKAILFSVGGDTAIDILSRLDYDLIKNKRKIISGISDATTLLHAITAKTGLVTYLGIELGTYAEDHEQLYQNEYIKRAWLEGEINEVAPNPNWKDLQGSFSKYAGWQKIKEGKAKGMLVGGNFSSFMQLVDTEYAMPFEDNILFFECYKYSKRKIHSALKKLELRGVLNKISGMIVGYFLESEDPEIAGNDQPIKDLILEVVEKYDFPVMQVGEIGHQVENFVQPIGAQVEIDASQLKVTFLEPVADKFIN